MKVRLKFIMHSIIDYSEDYDEKRIGREYHVGKIIMNMPVVMVCEDEDYGGFVTTRLQRRRTKNNILELTTANSTYVLEVLEE